MLQDKPLMQNTTHAGKPALTHDAKAAWGDG
jgi:hypothetical protein